MMSRIILAGLIYVVNAQIRPQCPTAAQLIERGCSRGCITYTRLSYPCPVCRDSCASEYFNNVILLKIQESHNTLTFKPLKYTDLLQVEMQYSSTFFTLLYCVMQIWMINVHQKIHHRVKLDQFAWQLELLDNTPVLDVRVVILIM